RVVERRREVQRLGNVAARSSDLLDAGDRRGRNGGEPQPAVRAEVLLRSEVVDIGLRHVEVDAARGARGVDHRQGALVARDASDRRVCTGRGLVVRPGVNVDAPGRLRQSDGTGLGRDDRRFLQPGRFGRGGELSAELAEGQVLTALLDEAEGCGIPECGRSTVAEDDLITLGQPEQLREALSNGSDEVLHRSLPMRGSEKRGTDLGERGHLGGANLRGAATEASVSGEKVGGDLERHAVSLAAPRNSYSSSSPGSSSSSMSTPSTSPAWRNSSSSSSSSSLSSSKSSSESSPSSPLSAASCAASACCALNSSRRCDHGIHSGASSASSPGSSSSSSTV